MLVRFVALPSLVVLAMVVVPAPGPLPPNEPRVTDGRLLYQRDCAFCHGDGGQGTPNGVSLQGIGDAEVDYTLSTGRMPKRDPNSPRNRRPPAYDAEQIKALIRYMTPFIAGGPTTPDVNPAAGDLAQGGELYRANCASCHQWAGEGGALLGLIAPSLHQASAVQVGEAVRSGPVNMPAFSAQTINAHDLDSITAYVLSLRHPKDRGGAGLWHLGPFTEGLVAWVIGMGLLLVGIVWIGERE